MSYNDTNCNHTGWGVGLSAIIGGALGYWAGRSGNYNGFGYGPYGAGVPAMAYAAGAASDAGHCRTCYQEGVQSGQSLAGLNYIGQQVAANSRDISNTFVALQNELNNQTATIQSRFDALNQQKIADQAAEIAALRTQNMLCASTAATNAQLTSINDKISSIVTNCGVRAYPGCPVSPCGCSNTNTL